MKKKKKKYNNLKKNEVKSLIKLLDAHIGNITDDLYRFNMTSEPIGDWAQSRHDNFLLYTNIKTKLEKLI